MNTNFELERKKLKQSKRIKAMLHILFTPSEKSINNAANCMSGRNVPTDLERKHDIQLVYPRIRQTANDGSLYSVYQLKDNEQVNKLIKLIEQYCLRYKLQMFDQVLIDKAKVRFEYYFKEATAKK
jgi:hypothetical protein